MPAREREDVAVLLAKLRPVIRQILGDWRVPPQDAEDLVQEALLKLVVRWDSLDNPGGWLLGTLRTLCYVRKRRGKRRELRLEEAIASSMRPEHEGEALLINPSVRPEQSRSDLFIDLRRLLPRLSPRSRELVVLRYELGLSAEECAARLGCRPGSIRKMSLRAVARLRAWLSQSVSWSGGAGPRRRARPGTNR